MAMTKKEEIIMWTGFELLLYTCSELNQHLAIQLFSPTLGVILHFH